MQSHFFLISALLLGVNAFPNENLEKPSEEIPCGSGKLCVHANRCSATSKSLDFNECPVFETCCLKDDIVPVSSAVCGHRNKDGVGFQIFDSENENKANFGEFPWMLAIMDKNNDSDDHSVKLRCGGSLIHPQVALTAAHCVQNRSPNSLTVRAGEWDIQGRTEIYPDQDNQVEKMVIHPEYNSESSHNDIALLFLEKPFDLAENVGTVCLPPREYQPDLSRCYATGWGKTKHENKDLESILKKIDLTVVPNRECQDKLRKTQLGEDFKLDNKFLCAGGEEGKDTCKGDGGSPLVCPINNKDDYFYQAGIVSWGTGCGNENVPGVYTNVAKFREWIDGQCLNLILNFFFANKGDVFFLKLIFYNI